MPAYIRLTMYLGWIVLLISIIIIFDPEYSHLKGILLTISSFLVNLGLTIFLMYLHTGEWMWK